MVNVGTVGPFGTNLVSLSEAICYEEYFQIQNVGHEFEFICRHLPAFCAWDTK